MVRSSYFDFVGHYGLRHLCRPVVPAPVSAGAGLGLFYSNAQWCDGRRLVFLF